MGTLKFMKICHKNSLNKIISNSLTTVRISPLKHLMTNTIIKASMDSDITNKEIPENEMYNLFEELLDKYNVKFNVGDRVVGTVVSMDKKFVYVDMGLKDYALLPREEVSLTGQRAEDILPIGESREFLVMRKSKREVQPFVSLKAFEIEVAWERARQRLLTEEIENALVVESTKGGYRVDLGGFKSFLPV